MRPAFIRPTGDITSFCVCLNLTILWYHKFCTFSHLSPFSTVLTPALFTACPLPSPGLCAISIQVWQWVVSFRRDVACFVILSWIWYATMIQPWGRAQARQRGCKELGGGCPLPSWLGPCEASSHFLVHHFFQSILSDGPTRLLAARNRSGGAEL